jgi:hypothetical protein
MKILENLSRLQHVNDSFNRYKMLNEQPYCSTQLVFYATHPLQTPSSDILLKSVHPFTILLTSLAKTVFAV